MTIEDKILKYIDNHDYVTYRELEVFFENSGIDWKGNLEIYSDVCDNVISGPAGMKRSFPHYCLFNHKVK